MKPHASEERSIRSPSGQPWLRQRYGADGPSDENRARAGQHGHRHFATFTLDLDRLCLYGPAGRLDLRRKSFDVLRYLVEHGGRVVYKAELLGAVWPEVTVTDESLTQCVCEIRRRLGVEGRKIIKTVARRGYLIDVPIEARSGGPASRSTSSGPAAYYTNSPTKSRRVLVITPVDANRPELAAPVCAFCAIDMDRLRDIPSGGRVWAVLMPCSSRVAVLSSEDEHVCSNQ